MGSRPRRSPGRSARTRRTPATRWRPRPRARSSSAPRSVTTTRTTARSNGSRPWRTAGSSTSRRSASRRFPVQPRLAPSDSHLYNTLARPLVKEGRLPNPHRVDEILVNRAAAKQLHISVGQRYTLVSSNQLAAFFGQAPMRGGPTVHAHVVGIGDGPMDLLFGPDEPGVHPEWRVPRAVRRARLAGSEGQGRLRAQPRRAPATRHRRPAVPARRRRPAAPPRRRRQRRRREGHPDPHHDPGRQAGRARHRPRADRAAALRRSGRARRSDARRPGHRPRRVRHGRLGARVAQHRVRPATARRRDGPAAAGRGGDRRCGQRGGRGLPLGVVPRRARRSARSGSGHPLRHRRGAARRGRGRGTRNADRARRGIAGDQPNPADVSPESSRIAGAIRQVASPPIGIGAGLALERGRGERSLPGPARDRRRSRRGRRGHRVARSARGHRRRPARPGSIRAGLDRDRLSRDPPRR